MPINVAARLASEERRLRAISGDFSDTVRGSSALLCLRDALGRLPGDLRYRLLELRFEADRLYLEGQARSHSDADLLAACLSKQKGFVVEPPRTEQMPGGGVAFVLTGTRSSAKERASP